MYDPVKEPMVLDPPLEMQEPAPVLRPTLGIEIKVIEGEAGQCVVMPCLAPVWNQCTHISASGCLGNPQIT